MIIFRRSVIMSSSILTAPLLDNTPLTAATARYIAHAAIPC